MDESTKIYQQVQDKIKEFKPLFDRLDEDEKLYLLEPFTMKKLNGTEDEKDVANVTLNDPLLYAKKAIAITGSYQRQSVIEGKNLTDKQASKIEGFSDDIFYMVDEWLARRDIPSLDAFINEKACMRGAIPARVCIRLNGEDSIIPDILPIDRRKFPYDVDDDGMTWAAPISSRSKARILKEYSKELGEGSGLRAYGNEVIDYWDRQRELVFIEKKLVREQPNHYGYVPFVQSICPIGSTLGDGIKHHGEGIFWPNRSLWGEKNEVTTILKTLSRKALKGGLELQVTDPDRAKRPEQSPYQEDVVIPTEKGGGFRQLPVNDIKAATNLLYSIMETCLQRGELTPLDYGTLTFPLSSVAILNLLAARNDIFAPILSMIASFYQSLNRMIIDQCVSLGREIKLGRPGGYNTYSPSDFEGEFSINYQFFLLSKEQSAADIAMANAARGLLPDKYILSEVIKVQDPEELMLELRSEQAEKTDEILFLYRRARALVDKTKPTQQDQIEAAILTERAETIYAQRKAMSSLSPMEGKREEEKPGEQVVPMFAKGKPQEEKRG